VWPPRAYRQYVDWAMKRWQHDLTRHRARLTRHVRPGARVLHIGCGWDRSNTAKPLLEICSVIGIDLDRNALERYPATVYHADASRMPFSGGTFDTVYCEYLLEHVSGIDALFGEVSRVLKPGGVFIFLTPNRWSYKSVIASVSGHGIHRWAARILRPDVRSPEDVYPTLYRANTPDAIERLSRKAGLSVLELELQSNGPTWFRRLPGVFEIGWFAHVLIDWIPGLAGLKCALEGALVKPGIGAVRPLEHRCTRCGFEPMGPTVSGWRCSSCDLLYEKRGQVVGTLGISPRVDRSEWKQT